MGFSSICTALIEVVRLNETKPFGHPEMASILVVGHDPRLTRSAAEAEYAFFFDYLTRSRPTWRPLAAKFDLANAVKTYIDYLASRQLNLADVSVTNLCNRFLVPPDRGGTVLIPDEVAEAGAAEISEILSKGRFRVVIPMSAQVFYHLGRLGFVSDEASLVKEYVRNAAPSLREAQRGAYVTVGRAPFLSVCGRRFSHGGIAVIPVLHVRQWRDGPRSPKYVDLMETARQQISALVGSEVSGEESKLDDSVEVVY
jgi:hypothetical protein